jgi:hypothetical protein
LVDPELVETDHVEASVDPDLAEASVDPELVETDHVEASVDPDPAEASVDPNLVETNHFEASVDPDVAEASVDPDLAEASVDPDLAEASVDPDLVEAFVDVMLGPGQRGSGRRAPSQAIEEKKYRQLANHLHLPNAFAPAPPCAGQRITLLAIRYSVSASVVQLVESAMQRLKAARSVRKFVRTRRHCGRASRDVDFSSKDPKTPAADVRAASATSARVFVWPTRNGKIAADNTAITTHNQYRNLNSHRSCNTKRPSWPSIGPAIFQFSPISPNFLAIYCRLHSYFVYLDLFVSSNDLLPQIADPILNGFALPLVCCARVNSPLMCLDHGDQFC